ncbi:DUF1652 domain-containing protein [Pseudomonas cyclaminis]|uniref:DUF1652 domain-containing protein n=1 Tax=Pseudomonas cyclaminis TaxID=2781239 RepID=UPI003816FC01
MLSILEVRHILETAFLPTRCVCKADSGGSLVVQLINPDTHQVDLTVTGIDARRLSSSRAIAKLVGEIKEEARLRASAPDKLIRYR